MDADACKATWLLTGRGSRLDLRNPCVGQIHLTDIARSLSQQCRFAGHTHRFYSVAEHSMRVADLVPPEDRLWALLHDAAEAYLVDLPRPIKRMLPDYCALEQQVFDVIAVKFGLEGPMPQSVKDADNAMVVMEGVCLMGALPDALGVRLTDAQKYLLRDYDRPAFERSEGPLPRSAEHMFLDRVRFELRARDLSETQTAEPNMPVACVPRSVGDPLSYMP